MTLPKFLVFFQSLDAKQISNFKKQVLTHIGQDTEAYGIVEYISTRKDWREEKYPGNEAMGQQCLPGVNQKVFLNYLSMLYEIAQEWIALDQLRRDPYEQDLLVQRWLNRKGLHQQAEQVRAKVLRLLDKEEGEDYRFARYRSEVHFEYLFCNNPDMNDYREEDYREMIQGFDAYFAGKASLMMCEVTNFSRYFHTDMTKELTHMTAKMNVLEKSRMAEIVQLAFKMLSRMDVKAWHQLSAAVLNGELSEGSLMHTVLTRYALKSGINLWSAGKHKEVSRIAEIARYGLSTGVYMEEGKLSPTSFHNLVVTLCQVLTEKEMMAFIKKWVSQVDVRYQKAAASIAKAQVNFYFGKYHLILNYTNVVDMSSNQRYLVQGLDLIATFENRLKDAKRYQRHVSNVSNYLKYNRDNLSTEALAKYRNLIKFLKDLDSKNGVIRIDDYNPIYYRKYCLLCLENKKGRPD